MAHLAEVEDDVTANLVGVDLMNWEERVCLSCLNFSCLEVDNVECGAAAFIPVKKFKEVKIIWPICPKINLKLSFKIIYIILQYYLHNKRCEEEDDKVLSDGEAVDYGHLVRKEGSDYFGIIISISRPPPENIHIERTHPSIAHPVTPVDRVSGPRFQEPVCGLPNMKISWSQHFSHCEGINIYPSRHRVVSNSHENVFIGSSIQFIRCRVNILKWFELWNFLKNLQFLPKCPFLLLLFKFTQGALLIKY